MVDIIQSIQLEKNEKSNEIDSSNINGKLIEELTKNNSDLHKKENIIKDEIESKKIFC